jgi:uncharacterized protein YkwD
LVFYFDIYDQGQNLLNQKDSTYEQDQANENPVGENVTTKDPTEGLITFIGKSQKEVEDKLGKPMRIDLSSFGYDWWIYNRNQKEYVQIGMENGKVVTLFAIGDNLNITPFQIGQSMGDIYSSHLIDTTVSVHVGKTNYQFELSEEDINTRPLTKVGNVYVQLYIDKFKGTLSSIRLMDTSTLIKMHPYAMVYEGKNIKVPLEEKLNAEKLDRDNERQIYDITNVIRARSHLKLLEWDENASIASLNKSKDLYENRVLLKSNTVNDERLDKFEKGVGIFSIIGENIAINYMDAPAAVEAWFNSKDARENLLNEEYTNLGMGVYKIYFTQNFLKR